jgi:hypothetical protein
MREFTGKRHMRLDREKTDVSSPDPVRRIDKG